MLQSLQGSFLNFLASTSAYTSSRLLTIIQDVIETDRNRLKHIIGILLVFIGSLLLAVYSCVVLCFDQVREAWAKVMSAEAVGGGGGP